MKTPTVLFFIVHSLKETHLCILLIKKSSVSIKKHDKHFFHDSYVLLITIMSNVYGIYYKRNQITSILMFKKIMNRKAIIFLYYDLCIFFL
jgi:hypothetical protein